VIDCSQILISILDVPAVVSGVRRTLKLTLGGNLNLITN